MISYSARVVFAGWGPLGGGPLAFVFVRFIFWQMIRGWRITAGINILGLMSWSAGEIKINNSMKSDEFDYMR